jgi:hypothetical protein
MPGQTVALDLVLRDSDVNALPVVAWELHLALSTTSPVALVPAEGSAEPVRQRGDPRLALDGLTRLTGPGDAAQAQYLTVQNRYTAQSGALDYAITLLGFNPARPARRVEPLHPRDGMVLGRITVRGVSRGVVDINPGAPDPAIQVVGVAASGVLAPAAPAAIASPLARINVDPAPAPVGLAGRVQRPGWQHAGATSSHLVSVSFWEPGALPPWLGGQARPAAVFDAVTLDPLGTFQVDDVTLAVLPPGMYDVRVKLPGGLSQPALGVRLPPASGAILAFGPPRHGDVNGDDRVDHADLAALKAAFGRLATDAGYRAHADFNADQVVDGQDFSILALHFGQHGE